MKCKLHNSYSLQLPLTDTGTYGLRGDRNNGNFKTFHITTFLRTSQENQGPMLRRYGAHHATVLARYGEASIEKQTQIAFITWSS